MSTKKKSEAERFWYRVKVLAKNSCWEWLGGKYHNGYGQFMRSNRKKTGSHRMSYELANGKCWTRKGLSSFLKIGNRPNNLVNSIDVIEATPFVKKAVENRAALIEALEYAVDFYSDFANDQNDLQFNIEYKKARELLKSLKDCEAE